MAELALKLTQVLESVLEHHYDVAPLLPDLLLQEIHAIVDVAYGCYMSDPRWETSLMPNDSCVQSDEEDICMHVNN